MRNFLAFVGATVIVVLGLGLYLGWYKVTPQKAGPGQSRLQVDINQEKIGQDVQTGLRKGAEKVQQIIDNAKENQAADPSKSSASGSSQGASLLSPPANNSQSSSDRAKEAFRDFIIDGWFGDGKKN